MRALFITLAVVLALGAFVSCSGEEETGGQGLPAARAAAGDMATGEKPIATLLEEADQAFRNDQYETAGKMFEEVSQAALDKGDSSTFVEAAAMRARSYLVQGDAEAGRPWLARAAESADVSEPGAWSRYLGVRGRFEWNDEDRVKATSTFREMFDYCEAHELYDRAIDAAHMIAITGDPSEKYEWAIKGIEMAEKSGRPGWLGPLWNNLGWDYVEAGRYDDALAALEKAREYHYMGTADIPKLIADYAVAHVVRLQGRLDESRDAMRAVFDRAEKLHADGNPDAIEWMGFSRWELGEIAINKGEVGVGLGMLEKALGELEEAGIEKWDPDDLQKRKARIEELRGE